MDVPRTSIKCLTIGSSGCGKTNLTRVASEAFARGGAGALQQQQNGGDGTMAAGFTTQANMTIGVEFASILIKARNHNFKLAVWDTAGQESFRSITRSYFRGAVGCFIVFDLANRASFTSVEEWLTDVRSNCGKTVEPSILLVGNKADLVQLREVTTEEAESFAAQHGLGYIETSAKTGQGVVEAFNKLAEDIADRIDSGKLDLAAMAGVKARANPAAGGGNNSNNSNSSGATNLSVPAAANRGGMDSAPKSGTGCCGKS